MYRVEVESTRLLALVLDEMGLEYAVHSDTEADIYGDVTVTELVMRLAEKQCEVFRIFVKDESLESYYIRLIGGGSYA